jgi:hypothetical protein
MDLLDCLLDPTPMILSTTEKKIQIMAPQMSRISLKGMSVFQIYFIASSIEYAHTTTDPKTICRNAPISAADALAGICHCRDRTELVFDRAAPSPSVQLYRACRDR